MYPQKLPPEPTKRNWSHADCFREQDGSLVQSFLHRNYSIGMHTHSFFELNIVMAGEGRHYIQEQSFPARRGCVYVIPAGVEHGYHCSRALDVYHLLIHRDFFPTLPPEVRDSFGFSMLFEIEPQLRTNASEAMFLTLSEEKLAQAELLIRLLEGYSRDRNLHRSYQNHGAQSLILFLCAAITDYYGLEQSSEEKRELFSMAQCIRYLQLNFEEKITVEQLARMACMSRSTFLRRFQKVCGCTPGEYLNRCRLEKYQQYLDQGYKKTQAAVMCGFYDMSHLYRVKKGMGGKNE